MSPNTKNNKHWYRSKIIQGKGLAKTLGYPTINLDSPEELKGQQEGVYLCRVLIRNKNYHGLLYYGPRLVLHEKQTILEIYVMDFNEMIYGETIQFQLLDYIRDIMEFADLTELKKQIKKDFAKAQEMLEYR